jgi:hypothetical protein
MPCDGFLKRLELVLSPKCVADIFVKDDDTAGNNTVREQVDNSFGSSSIPL